MSDSNNLIQDPEYCILCDKTYCDCYEDLEAWEEA